MTIQNKCWVTVRRRVIDEIVNNQRDEETQGANPEHSCTNFGSSHRAIKSESHN